MSKNYEHASDTPIISISLAVTHEDVRSKTSALATQGALG